MFDDVIEVDDGCGNHYFMSTASGASGWTKEEAAGVPLPAGIVAGFDEASGYAYYCHEASGATGWSVDEVLQTAAPLGPSEREPPWRQEPPTPPKGPPSIKDAPALSSYGHYDGKGNLEPFSPEQAWLLEDAFARGVDRVKLACPQNPIGLREFEVRFGMYAISDRVPTPPPTRMIQVNLESGATRVVRREAPCAHVVDDARTHDGTVLRCRGCLLKKGGGTSLFGRRKWQDRFVDLDPVRGTLTYYADRDRRHCKGSLRVGAATRVSDDVSSKQFRGRAKGLEDPCYFAVSLLVDAATGAPRPGALELRATYRDDLERWRAAIEWAVATVSTRAQHRLSTVDRKDAPPLPQRASQRVASDKVAPPLPPRTPEPPGPATSQKPKRTPSPVFYDAVQSPARRLFPAASPPTPSPKKAEPAPAPVAPAPPASAPVSSPAPPPTPSRPKPPPPPPRPKPPEPAAASGDPALAKYENMLRMHLPQGAVEQKMRADGVDPALLFPDAAPAPAKLVLPKPTKQVAPRPAGGSDLMAQLKAGVALKKAAPVGPAPPKADGLSGLAEAIAASASRRPSPRRRNGGRRPSRICPEGWGCKCILL